MAPGEDGPGPGGAQGSVVPGSDLLLPNPTAPPLDMAPFVVRAYAKSNANDIFADYAALACDAYLRIAHFLKKVYRAGCILEFKCFFAGW